MREITLPNNTSLRDCIRTVATGLNYVAKTVFIKTKLLYVAKQEEEALTAHAKPPNGPVGRSGKEGRLSGAGLGASEQLQGCRCRFGRGKTGGFRMAPMLVEKLTVAISCFFPKRNYEKNTHKLCLGAQASKNYIITKGYKRVMLCGILEVSKNLDSYNTKLLFKTLSLFKSTNRALRVQLCQIFSGRSGE